METLEYRLVKYLSDNNFDGKEQHLTQLDLVISELDYLIRKLNKMHSTFSEDQNYLHKNSLEALLKLNAKNMMKSNPIFLEKVIQGWDIWARPSIEPTPENDFIRAFGNVSKSNNINDGGFYTVIMNALYYLFYSLKARQMMVSAESYDFSDKIYDGCIDETFMSLLAGFSTDRTIKNDITRKKYSAEEKTNRRSLRISSIWEY